MADQGIGIPSRDIDRMFERFYRVDKARSRDTGGTGLGLSIVRHVATNHGGEVLVSSQEGEGSTFVFASAGCRSIVADPASSPSGADRSRCRGAMSDMSESHDLRRRGRGELRRGARRSACDAKGSRSSSPSTVPRHSTEFDEVAARPRAPRRDVAEGQRHRGLPAAAQADADADHHGDRQGRRDRHRRRPGGRRRRLRHQAVPAPRTRRPDASGAAPLPTATPAPSSLAPGHDRGRRCPCSIPRSTG